MRWRYLGTPVFAVALVTALTNCDDGLTDPEFPPADLMVNLTVIGDTADPDGATVSIDGGDVESIFAGETKTFPSIEAGTHQVLLGDLAPYCLVRGANPQNVTVSGEPVEVRFELKCGNTDVEDDLIGMDILGSGYDLSGNYADLNDVMGHVLDVDALRNSGLIDQLQYERAVFETITGTSVEEYTSAFALRVSIRGSGFGFSGAARVNFESSRYSSEQYSFATVQNIVRKYGLRIPLDLTASHLRDFLTERAREAINNETDVDFLFDTFGTHVVRGLIVGARLDYSISGRTSILSEKENLSTYARASYNGIFSASISVGVVNESEFESWSATESRRVEVYGGRSELGQDMLNNRDNYQAWLLTVDEYPAFMDFEKRGLIPLYELAETPERQQELEVATSKYLAARGISVQGEGSIITNFESEAEGWTCDQNAETAADPCSIEHFASGGFAGGYVSITDNDTSDDSQGALMRYRAPAAYEGDWSRFAPVTGGSDGVLYAEVGFRLWTTYDPSSLDPSPAQPALLIESPYGNLRFMLDERADAAWGSFDDASSTFFPGDVSSTRIFLGNASVNTIGRWEVFRGSTGAWTEADDQQIDKSLAWVTRFYILGDYVRGTAEQTMLDEVRVCTPSADGSC